MKRAKRLEPVNALMSETERGCAQQLSLMQARLLEAEQRCQELKRYLSEYHSAFHQRARAGIGVSGMRDYQTFIARLGEAVQQQDGIVAQLRGDCERARAQWREAAARKSAVGKVIERARAEESQVEARRQQRESDERAQRAGGSRS
ncbi:MAG TPA: flagellar export protein FliJ [Steroidobacteraceae bacterium]|nr:flagellar export protein FliJ [Steroidobacteraceae bacterium]